MALNMRSKLLYPLAEIIGNRDILSKLSALQENSEETEHCRKKRVQKQIFEMLKTCQLHVPYYRDLFKSLQFDPECIKSDISFLQEVPFLTKDIVKEQGRRLLNEKLTSNLHMRKTGGSTGPTLPIYYDTNSLDWTAAENIFVLGFTGYQFGQKEFHIISRPYEPKTRTKMHSFLKNSALNRYVFECSTLDDESLLKLFLKLKKIRPFLVQGPPSVLYALALFMNKQKLIGRKLFDAFESTGETLDHVKREQIEKFLGCKVYNRYGTAEFGVVAHSRNSYCELQVVDQIVYPETYSLGNGLNELVFTSLKNSAMPLIRYKTGDIGDLFEKNGHFWITKLQGRIHDTVSIDNKPYLTSYIQDIVEQIGGIDEFQISIDADGTKTLKLVASNQTDKNILSEKIKSFFGNEFNIEFVNFSDLVLQGWRSKFRYVVKQKT